MTFCKRFTLMFLSVFILSFFLLGCRTVEVPGYSQQETMVSAENIDLDMFTEDSVLILLGKSFTEIIQVLGEPDEQGDSSLYGPHYYLLYLHKDGVIRLCSPKPMEKKIAVSIFLGPGQEVLGARVGMTFTEIMDILGAPAYGPEFGMDNKYYMDYFIEETNHPIQEVFISFSAEAIDSVTDDVFIKWEAYEYDNVEIM